MTEGKELTKKELYAAVDQMFKHYQFVSTVRELLDWFFKAEKEKATLEAEIESLPGKHAEKVRELEAKAKEIEKKINDDRVALEAGLKKLEAEHTRVKTETEQESAKLKEELKGLREQVVVAKKQLETAQVEGKNAIGQAKMDHNIELRKMEGERKAVADEKVALEGEILRLKKKASEDFARVLG